MISSFLFKDSIKKYVFKTTKKENEILPIYCQQKNDGVVYLD